MPIISILEIKLQEKWKKSLILFVLLKDFYKQVFSKIFKKCFFSGYSPLRLQWTRSADLLLPGFVWQKSLGISVVKARSRLRPALLCCAVSQFAILSLQKCRLLLNRNNNVTCFFSSLLITSVARKIFHCQVDTIIVSL